MDLNARKRRREGDEEAEKEESEGLRMETNPGPKIANNHVKSSPLAGQKALPKGARYTKPGSKRFSFCDESSPCKYCKDPQKSKQSCENGPKGPRKKTAVCSVCGDRKESYFEGTLCSNCAHKQREPVQCDACGQSHHPVMAIPSFFDCNMCYSKSSGNKWMLKKLRVQADFEAYRRLSTKMPFYMNHARVKTHLENGVSVSLLEKLLEAANYQCQLCGRNWADISRLREFENHEVPTVDHHIRLEAILRNSEMAVRGIVCSRCNSKLGMAGDNCEDFIAMAAHSMCLFLSDAEDKKLFEEQVQLLQRVKELWEARWGLLQRMPVSNPPNLRPRWHRDRNSNHPNDDAVVALRCAASHVQNETTKEKEESL